MNAGTRRAFINSGIAAALSPFYTAGVAGQTAARVRPHLHNLRRKAVSISWIALEAAAGSVDAGAAGMATRTSVKAKRKLVTAGVYRYQADLEDLEPGQPYAYCVRHNGAAIPGCEALAFRTPASRGTGSRIVALGDSGTDSPAQRQLAAMMIARQPEVMLHTGDLVYPSGTLESYLERFFAPYAPLLERIPVFPCPGNHDYYHEQANFYVALHALPSAGVPDEGQGRYYSFDWDNAHFVVLDSNTPLEDAAAGRGPMLEWLEKDLAASRQFWKIAMFHHPPFAGGPNQGDPLSALARQHIVPILERHGVQLVLNGHEHNYQRSHAINGIVYLTTGGGGADLYEPLPRAEAAFQQGSYHFLETELKPTELTTRAIRIDGATIDSLTLKPEPRAQRLVNPASQTAAIAPGGLAAIHGRHLAPREGDLESVRVFVRHQPAQVVFAAPDQVTFIVPPDLVGDAEIRIETANGQAGLAVLIHESAPAIFLLEKDGRAFPSLFHADGAPVTKTNPARLGEELALYFTGAGAATAGSVESGDFAQEARIEPAPDQPGVHRLFFRPDVGTGATFCLRIGTNTSNAAAWSVR